MKHLRVEENPGFSQGVVHRGILHIAGLVGPPTSNMAAAKGTDTVTQTQQIFQKMDGIMGEAGTIKSRVLSMNCYLKNIKSDYAGYNKARMAWIDPDSKGASFGRGQKVLLCSLGLLGRVGCSSLGLCRRCGCGLST